MNNASLVLDSIHSRKTIVGSEEDIEGNKNRGGVLFSPWIQCLTYAFKAQTFQTLHEFSGAMILPCLTELTLLAKEA